MIKAKQIDNDYVSGVQKDIKIRVVMKCSLLNLTRKIQMILFKFSIKLYGIVYMKMKKS